MRRPASTVTNAAKHAAMVERYKVEFPDLTVAAVEQYIRQADRSCAQYDPEMVAEMRDDPDFQDFLFDIRMESDGGRFALLVEGAINDLPAPEGPVLKGALKAVMDAGGGRARALRTIAPHWFTPRL
jgi:hypothetical protein